MKLGSKVVLDIGRFVATLGGGYADESGLNLITNATAIKRSIEEFVRNDKAFVAKIQKLLIGRLKFASGTLIESFSLNTFDASGKGKSSSPQIGVRLEMHANDKSLIRALLGEKELDDSGSIPSIEVLMQYVRNKRKYFNDSITALKHRQDTMRMLLQIQKMEHSKNAKIHTPSAETSEFADPIRDIAHQIRGAMLARKAHGLSPTKGSEYVFIGNYPEYDDDKAKFSFKPKYSKMQAPLLGRRISLAKGLINILISNELEKYMKNLMDQYVDYIERKFDVYGHPKNSNNALANKIRENIKSSKANKNSSSEIADVLCLIEFSEKGDIQKQLKLIQEAESIISKNLSAISNKDSVQSRAYLANAQRLSREVVDAVLPRYTTIQNKSNKKTMLAIKRVRKEVNEMKAYFEAQRKRRATRRRGR